MPNERLRSCITAAGLTVDDVAKHVDVDRKTVERWITTGRLPHRPHREAVAALLRTEDSYLWPELLDGARVKSASGAEVLAVYPSRSAVPANLWYGLLEGAAQRVEVLVFSGLFLPDTHPAFAHTLITKADNGAAVRLALGDHSSDAVRLRGAEEGIGDGMAARIRLSLTYLQDAIEAPSVEVRLHYGMPAAQSPVLHLRQLSSGRLFRHYEASFKRVWEQASPYPAMKES